MDDHKIAAEADTQEKTILDQFATIKTPQEAIIGTMLGSRYRIKRKLGYGGFGVVYLASDEKMLSRPVVVKALHDDGPEGNYSARKFQQEIEALARIDHPSIVGIFDVGEMPDGKPYIVMQYVDGFSLRSVISPEGLDFWRAANIMRQAGRALSAAHDRGILHRDLKPENIMVQTLGGGEEQVKIIDFGIARVKNSVVSFTTASDKTVGTIAYMSPEQLIAGQVSPASDVYCLAVIAYELLTGRRPANPESAYQLLEMQRAGVRIRPTDLRPGLPQQAEAIILKALSFEPQNRPQRARDFGDFLANALVSDDEQTVLASASLPAVSASRETSSVAAPETAHVLMMELVGFSEMMADEQPACLQKLQNSVNQTQDFIRAESSKELIRLPISDGIALVFFGDPEAPLRCALDISNALKDCPDMKMRMGIHSGLVYRMADINTNMNVAGGGINVAQRVMETGDAGHILVSQRVADDLRELARWAPCLHDLGEVEVKHGLRVHLFNLYTNDFGNPRRPSQIGPAQSRVNVKRLATIAAVTLVALLIIVAIAAFALKPRRVVNAPPVAAAVPALPQQSYRYSLTVQKMRGSKPDGGEIEMSGQEVYGNGWRFRFNLVPDQKGGLYLINEAPNSAGRTEFNTLFPTPRSGGTAVLQANQRVQTSWLRFVDNSGLEKLWIIWTSSPVADLDQVFRDAALQQGALQGVLTESQVATVQTYLKRYETERPEVNPDETQTSTVVKGKGNIVVSLLKLQHKAY
ncbi:MAG: protein kinase [Acidobacteriota bacterium]